MSAPTPLQPNQLYTRCDPAQFSFDDTSELTPLEDGIGQDRANEALGFGLGMRHPGFNLFALGPTGTGKYRMVRRHIERQAAGEPVPPDWCYVNNFAEPYRPRALRLPAGRGAAFRTAMERLVEDLQAALPAAFESDEFRTRKEAIDNEFKERQQNAFEGLQKRAVERGIALVRTPNGFALAPTREGEVLNPEEFQKLDEATREKLQADIQELEKELGAILSQAPNWAREHHNKVREVVREVSSFAVHQLIAELRKSFEDLPQLLVWIDELERDIVENVEDFLKPEGGVPDDAPPMLRRALAEAHAPFRRYRVNLIIDNRAIEGAPVVYLDHPIHANLVGRIEHMAQLGAMMTDFNLIRPGALHRANGGYLIIDARKILMQPHAWEELKRVLRAHEIRIEALAEALGIVSTASLEPQPIPLDIKVTLIGDRMLYYMLSEMDPDFPELFKVAVDFEDQIPRSAENHQQFARLLGTIAQREDLKPLTPDAVARVIEHAARLIDDAERLSTHVRSVADLLREADHRAGADGESKIAATHVDGAIAAQQRRLDRVRERSHEQIARGTILIDIDGAHVGQVNGLSVRQLGEFRFGGPTRITARTRMGRGEVVDIEREVDLGGPLHSKGVMILAGYLGARFAQTMPLALSASLVFEQSYGGVDGDSASSTELYALLSALSDVPIKQSFAVTGSVNQYGEVQAIGGVNEKIEGFFDVCKSKALTGEQGVLIPASNVKHLMLRRDVVEAVEQGQFQIFPVHTIDQGIEILTGVPAGEAGADGAYPPDSINGRVMARLADYAERARAFAARREES